jgi:hypothetical protein
MKIQLLSIAKLWLSLPVEIKSLLAKKSDELCTEAGDSQWPEEPPSMTPRCLLTDCVAELMYRAEAGRDGNWEEFAGHWLTDDHADEILKFMGYTGWMKGENF